MDDSRIIELYFSRDEAAIIETERTYGKRLGHLSFGILKDSEDAGECVNDTYLRAWNAIPPQKPTFFMPFSLKFAEIFALTGWTITVPIREILNLFLLPLNWKTVFPTDWPRLSLDMEKSVIP